MQSYQLIEVAGPSGVGKSTALERMLRDPDHAAGVIGRPTLETLRPRKLDPVQRHHLDASPYRPALDLVFHILARSPAPLSSRMAAMDMCQASFLTRAALATPEDSARDDLLRGQRLVHDELVLHRAFSILPFSENRLRDARAFFNAAPLPDQAVICIADPRTIMARIRQRGRIPNCYKGLEAARLEILLHDLVDCGLVAQECLTRRGVRCTVLRFDGSPDEAALDLGRACMPERIAA